MGDIIVHQYQPIYQFDVSGMVGLMRAYARSITRKVLVARNKIPFFANNKMQDKLPRIVDRKNFRYHRNFDALQPHICWTEPNNHCQIAIV